MPRHIASEIQRIEREFQNQQVSVFRTVHAMHSFVPTKVYMKVEVRLVAALARGQQYLDTENFAKIDVSDLEDVRN